MKTALTLLFILFLSKPHERGKIWNGEPRILHCERPPRQDALEGEDSVRARTTRKIVGFTLDEWNSIGAEAGRTARAARFRQGLPVVVEVEGVPMYEYPDGTFKTVAEYDAEEYRAAGERQAR